MNFMKVRKHFRTSVATIDYIISDFGFNRIVNKDIYFRFCVNKRMHQLNEQYDQKLDKILDFLITHCDYDDLPLDCLSKIILSLSRVTNALSKGFISIIS